MSKVLRFSAKGEVRYGLLEGTKVRVLQGNPFDFQETASTVSLEEVQILAPCDPSKIVCVGLNYRDHAEEIKAELPEEPHIFLKPPTALIGPGEAILLPSMSSRVDYEGELALVIKKRAKGVSRKEAPDYILGYTCFNDVTARDLVAKDKGPLRAKIFDTFAALGPWIASDVDPTSLAIRTYLNGELRQSSNTKNLIFDPFHLVSFISSVLTLLPGDVISTGTPSGIGSMRAGDLVEVEIEGIGRLSNPVALPEEREKK
ncbi:MAG: fumarylacetoacetate hydrolase family protein [candidate division NC10 bacterium]|nr:fumarylacetoacetate hydrolase family protein [candidate division NC10 bacterium]